MGEAAPGRSEPRLETLEPGDRVVDAGRAPGGEALAELDPDQESVVARAAVHRVQKAHLREHRLRLYRFRPVELALETSDRGAPDFDHGRDVHDEVRLLHETVSYTHLT